MHLMVLLIAVSAFPHVRIFLQDRPKQGLANDVFCGSKFHDCRGEGHSTSKGILALLRMKFSSNLPCVQFLRIWFLGKSSESCRHGMKTFWWSLRLFECQKDPPNETEKTSSFWWREFGDVFHRRLGNGVLNFSTTGAECSWNSCCKIQFHKTLKSLSLDWKHVLREWNLAKHSVDIFSELMVSTPGLCT